MPLAPDPNNILLGKGELFFDRFNAAGLRQGYFHLGNCAGFGVELKDTILSLYTSQHSTAGLLKRVTSQREVDVTIKSNEFGITNLALALMGDETSVAQVLSTATETLAAGFTLGRYYRTAKRNISALAITQGTSTWSLNTDFTIKDANAGIYQVAPAASTAVATTASAVLIYTASAQTLSAILGATHTKIEGSLLFVPDPTTGPQFDIEIYRCSQSPGGTQDFIGEQFGEYTLSMAALDDSAGAYGGSTSSPYFRLIQRGVA
jgi:hypothetical protein